MAENLTDAIVDILNRNGDVVHWPEDEQRVFRRLGWRSFTERNDAVTRLRAQKIIALVEDSRG